LPSLAREQHIETIEGLAKDGSSSVAAGFIEYGGFQCGICTGQIMAAKGAPRREPKPTEDEVKRMDVRQPLPLHAIIRFWNR
jgi:aerobic-type carbon monoxide dehydrogenase small subunit (CoxS/CutS family)